MGDKLYLMSFLVIIYSKRLLKGYRTVYSSHVKASSKVSFQISFLKNTPLGSWRHSGPSVVTCIHLTELSFSRKMSLPSFPYQRLSWPAFPSSFELCQRPQPPSFFGCWI